MQVDLRYGHGDISVNLPAESSIHMIRKPSMPLLERPADAVSQAIRTPVGVAPLTELADGANSACIVICDITRPVPNHLFLRPIIEVLLNSGIEKEQICILIATGLHRPNVGAELKELIGDTWVLENVQVFNHDAREADQHVAIGETPTRGTVVKLDRRFVDADIRIATGLVEPHFMAGYSGGRKVIAPGIAHAETITTFHSARFMEDPAARNCNFEANPLHEEQLEIVRMLGGCLALNTVIDEDRNLSFVNFGDIIESHTESVAFVREFCEVEVDRKFSTVLTSSSGYPLDKTYYQTIKGMVGAMDILQPGGDLIIVSQCSEGFGSREFRDAQSRLIQQGRAEFLSKLLDKSHAEIDEWQTQMLLKPSAIGQIQLFAEGLTDEDSGITGVERIYSVEKAVAASVARSADKAVAVIPEGPYVVPFSRLGRSVVPSDSL